MNNIKRISGILLALCLVLSIAFTAVACTDDNEDIDGTATTQTTTVTTTTVATTTTTTDDPATPTKVTYKVTVKDQDGNPVKGAAIQLCDGDLCKLPVLTDDSGVSLIEADPANYTVKYNAVPDGYKADTNEYSFEEGSTELTLTLEKEEAAA